MLYNKIRYKDKIAVGIIIVLLVVVYHSLYTLAFNSDTQIDILPQRTEIGFQNGATSQTKEQISALDWQYIQESEDDMFIKEAQLESEAKKTEEFNSKSETEKKMKQSFEDSKAIYNYLTLENPSTFQFNYTLDDFEDVKISKGNKLFQMFMGQYFTILSENRQTVLHPDRAYDKNGKPGIPNIVCLSSQDIPLSENELIDIMAFPEDFLEDLSSKHFNVASSIPSELPFNNFYSGNGYVMVGGGKYSWFALLSVKTLRKMGSSYPVEVLIPAEDEYDELICESLLTELNGKCIKMWEVFGLENLEKLGELAGYQYKSFALLASSFENVFMLDADAFPVSNPDLLFDSLIFKNYGMVTWADFWRRTTSPFYYQIAGIQLGSKEVKHLNDFYTKEEIISSTSGSGNLNDDEDPRFKIPLHNVLGSLPEWSTESGELLINKKTHFNALLLSLYYNLDGPYGYYPLLSQGACGEGDKESFVTAAHFFSKPQYQVYKGPDKAYGWYKGTSHEHSTIIQYDPLRDFNNLLRSIHDGVSVNENGEYSYGNFRDSFNYENSKVLFYHVHDPKIDPFYMMETDKTLDLSKNKMRNLGDLFPGFQFDLELYIWETINKFICEDDLKFENVFKDKTTQDFEKLCRQFIPDQLGYLKKSTVEINSKYALEHERAVAKQIELDDKDIDLLSDNIEDSIKNDIEHSIMDRTTRLSQFERLHDLKSIEAGVLKEIQFYQQVRKIKVREKEEEEAAAKAAVDENQE